MRLANSVSTAEPTIEGGCANVLFDVLDAWLPLHIWEAMGERSSSPNEGCVAKGELFFSLAGSWHIKP